MWLLQNAPGANSCNINLIWSCQICAIFLMKHLENIDSIDRGKDSKRNLKKNNTKSFAGELFLLKFTCKKSRINNVTQVTNRMSKFFKRISFAESIFILKKSITKRRKEFLPCKIHSFQSSMLNSDLDLDLDSVFVAYVYPFEMHAHKKCSIRICHNPKIITLINEWASYR